MHDGLSQLSNENKTSTSPAYALHAGNFSFCLSSTDFFQAKIFKNFFYEYCQCVKQFGSRSGPMFCLS